MLRTASQCASSSDPRECSHRRDWRPASLLELDLPQTCHRVCLSNVDGASVERRTGDLYDSTHAVSSSQQPFTRMHLLSVSAYADTSTTGTGKYRSRQVAAQLDHGAGSSREKDEARHVAGAQSAHHCSQLVLPSRDCHARTRDQAAAGAVSVMARKSRWRTLTWVAAALTCLAAVPILRTLSAPRLSPTARAAADMLKRQHMWRQAVRDGDVPKLSNRRAPWGLAWRNSIALCSTVRQENTTDLREWLMYYRCARVLCAARVRPVLQAARQALLLAHLCERVFSGAEPWHCCQLACQRPRSPRALSVRTPA